MRRPFVWNRATHGQGVVEFALVSLVLLMLMFGTIDLGRGVFQRSMLTNAVREAARYGSISSMSGSSITHGPSDSAGILAAAQRTSPTLNLTASNITTTCYRYNDSSNTWTTLSSCSGAKTGDRLKVVGTYTFGLSAPQLIGWTSIVMTDSAQVMVQ